MDFPECFNSYEELRKKNMERNAEVMRSLGLLSKRLEEGDDVGGRPPRRRSSARAQQAGEDSRRSARIVAVKNAALEVKKSLSLKAGGIKVIAKTTEKFEEVQATGEAERQTLHVDMEDSRNVHMQGSSDESLCSENELEESFPEDFENSVFCQTHSSAGVHANESNNEVVPYLQSSNSMMATSFGSEFHDSVLRAVKESTAALIGHCSGLLRAAEGVPIQDSSVHNIDALQSTTWKESSFMIAEARRKRKPQMLRFSAGEESDSQEEFRAPVNESTQERALRIRRLNRFRAKRSKELTSNRKGMKKSPYILHVDGSGKARGIHKHQWRAAIRGQCSRLDPSMDNINHHPKAVVDSLWHALEKEWEFVGFGHRAREMFEKSATKFMRNRKMQLKYKFKKIEIDTKPDDVSAFHWSKIVGLTKKSSEHPISSASPQKTLKGKEKSIDFVQEKELMSDVQTTEFNMSRTRNTTVEEEFLKDIESVETSLSGVRFQEGMKVSVVRKVGLTDDVGFLTGRSKKPMRRRSPIRQIESPDILYPENEEVDATIQKLKTELLRLQHSKECRVPSGEKQNEFGPPIKGEHGTMVTFDKVAAGMKENVMPGSVNGKLPFKFSNGSTSKRTEEGLRGQSLSRTGTYGSVLAIGEGAKENICASGGGPEKMEMEYGDVVAVLANIEGRREEIGKAILMGFSGSKFARKVIPKGWCTVNVISCTENGRREICPVPAGWKDQVQEKTVKDREGKTILWPRSLLRC